MACGKLLWARYIKVFCAFLETSDFLQETLMAVFDFTDVICDTCFI